MESYLEINLEIRPDAKWFRDLRKALSTMPVKWQDKHFHITLAFLNEPGPTQDILPVMDKYIKSSVISGLTFDKLDVFTTNSGAEHIVNLTATDIPDSFKEWVSGLRAELSEKGCVMDTGFRLHVTLGRADAELCRIEDLQALVQKVVMPPFNLSFSSYKYKNRTSRQTIKKWNR